MVTIKNILWDLLNVLRIAGPLQVMWKHKYLSEKGWFRSFAAKESIDQNGEPIPWFTYPMIQFLEPRLNRSMIVFEYGCGNSTRWFSKYVKEVSSVDHDELWVKKIAPVLPANAAVQYEQLSVDGAYAKAITTTGREFDVVVIDGRDRNNCARYAIQHLTSEGIIIFDNSHLIEYHEAVEYLHANGFKQIDFFGILPIVPHENCTSVFYRTKNCLNI